MDPNTNTNQDPLTAGDSGATSFTPEIDMTAINEAVAAGGEENNIQNTFDVNDINLDNTPTTDADLQKQLSDDPKMSLANSSVGVAALDAAAQPQAETEVAGFVDGDLANEPAAPAAVAEAAPAEPIAQDPVAGFEDSSVAAPIADAPVTTETPAIAEAEPIATDTPVADPATDVAPEVATDTPAEPATVADLANAAPAAEEPAAAPAAANPVGPMAVENKSKAPTYILIGLAIVAVCAVAIAVIVSL